MLYTSTSVLLLTVIYSICHFFYLCYEYGLLEMFLWKRCLISLAISFCVAIWGLRRKSIDYSGAICGVCIGTIIAFSSYCFMACLLTFFYTSSKMTHIYSKHKKKIEADYKDGGQRNWIQVMCNGCMAAEFALLCCLHSGAGEFSIDFNNNYLRSWLSTAVIASLAGANGDTWASEIGTAFTFGTKPRLITTLKMVPIGTNGGVSILGIVVSAVGGSVVGLGYFLALFALNSDVVMNQAIILLSIGTVAGLFGSLMDSFIGATLQFSGFDKTTEKVVQEPGPFVEHISGKPILSNHSVNMIMTLFTALFVPFVTSRLFLYFV